MRNAEGGNVGEPKNDNPEITEQLPPYPDQATAGDRIHAVARAAAGAIPVAGNAIQVLVEQLVQAPLAKRRDQWFRLLAEAVGEVCRRTHRSEDELASDEAFASAAIRASRIGVMTDKAEKLAALKAAVTNAGIPGAVDESEAEAMIDLVDQLTPAHLQVLAVLDDPPAWMARHGSQREFHMDGAMETIHHCLPDLRGRDDDTDRLVRDLQARNLVRDGRFLRVTMTGNGMVQSRTTPFGRRFVEFISLG